MDARFSLLLQVYECVRVRHLGACVLVRFALSITEIALEVLNFLVLGAPRQNHHLHSLSLSLSPSLSMLWLT